MGIDTSPFFIDANTPFSFYHLLGILEKGFIDSIKSVGRHKKVTTWWTFDHLFIFNLGSSNAFRARKEEAMQGDGLPEALH